MANFSKKLGSDFETDSHDLHLQAQVRTLRRIDVARGAATLVALLMGVVVLGVAGNGLHVYQGTHISGATWLSLWPAASAFDLRPTVAQISGAAIVVLANLVALLSHHKLIRSKLAAMHTPLTFTAPLCGLIAAVIAMAFFYAINASETADSLLSWSCRWRSLSLSHGPDFAALCHASWAGVYLSILLIPVEALVLGLAGWQLKLERFTVAYLDARRTPSPAMS